MIPLRTQIKLFLEEGQAVDLAAFMPVFQRWIQQKAIEGQLIDVADYRHVVDGPGIVLIGHDSDYGMERREGRVGLLFTRKRQVDADLQTQLRASLYLALTAARLLETERAFTPRLKFRGDEIEIRFADRLQIPNRPESFGLVRDDLNAILSDLYGEDGAFALPVRQDARYLFTVKVRAEEAISIANLLVRQPSIAK